MWEEGLGRFNTLQGSFAEDLVSLVNRAGLAVGGDSQTILSIRKCCQMYSFSFPIRELFPIT